MFGLKTGTPSPAPPLPDALEQLLTPETLSVADAAKIIAAGGTLSATQKVALLWSHSTVAAKVSAAVDAIRAEQPARDQKTNEFNDERATFVLGPARTIDPLAGLTGRTITNPKPTYESQVVTAKSWGG